MGPGAVRDRRPHRHRASGRAGATRSCTTSAGPATTASSSGSSTPGASTPTTRTPTSARRGRGSATRRGWASTGPRPTTPTPRVIFLISAHLEAGHYFNPHAQRIIEGQQNGATGHLRRPPPVQHGVHGRPLAAGLAGDRARAPAGAGPAAARGGDLGPGVRPPLGQLGDVPPGDPTRPALLVRVGGTGPARPLRRLHPGAGGRAVRARRRADPRDRPAHRRRARAASRPTPGGPPARATRAAGRPPAACGS